MSLIVGATPFSQWERLEPFFQQLGWNARPVSEQALAGAIASSSTPCLLLHTRPELAVARALEQGQAPGEALEQWQNAAQVLLNVLRANRSRCLMLEVNSALAAPEQLLTWLESNRPGFLPLPPDITSQAFTPEAPESPNDRDLLLATQLVAQAEHVKTVLAPLEASTVPLSDEGYTVPPINIEQLRQQWQDGHHEFDSLDRTLRESQASLEAERAKVATLEKRVSQLESELAASRDQNGEKARLERDLQAVKTDKAAQEAQNQATLDQLFKVQEELEKYHLQDKELKEQLRVANRDLTQTTKKLNAMQASLFWRITAPARLGLGLVYKVVRKIKRKLVRR